MWVRRVRCEVRNLMQFHLDYSRLHAKLSLLTEIRLGLDFAVLLLACRALRILLYLRGPYGARAVVGVMTAAAGRVCAASEKSLAFLNPPALGSFRRDSAGDGAAI